MSNTNSDRVTHDLSALPSWAREDSLNQILNDLFEEDSGFGFTEVSRSSNFVSTITVWDSVSQNYKRSETTFNRTGVFIDSIVKNVWDEQGVNIVATITATFNRNPNNTASDIEVSIVRP